MKTPTITEQEIGIIKKAQSGDILAFNQLFRKYKGFVDNLLNKYIKDMDESKDITNIVFLKVYDKLSQFTEYSSFGGWLRILAKNTAIDYLRNVKIISNPIEQDEYKIPLEENLKVNNRNVIDKMTNDEIVEYIKSLPEKKQKVTELFYIEGFTMNQISEILSMPIGSVKSILSRIRVDLKNHFKSI